MSYGVMSEEQRKLGRTPSGQNLEGKVKKLRTFFLKPHCEEGCKQSIKGNSVLKVNQPNRQRLRNSKSLNRSLQPKKSVSHRRSCVKHSIVTGIKECKQTQLTSRSTREQLSRRETVEVQETHQNRSSAFNQKISVSVNANYGINKREDINTDAAMASNQKTEETTQQEHMSEDEMQLIDPENMSFATVMAMFRKLDAKISDLQRPVQSIIDEATTKIEEKSKQIAKDNIPEVSELKRQLLYEKRKNRTMGQLLQAMHDEFGDLKSRVESLEISNTKRQITLTNFYAEGEKDEVIEQIQDFLEDEIGLRPVIEDTYPIGGQIPPTRVVIFQTLNEKKEIMKHKDRLKNIENCDKNQYYINDYLPQPVQERRRREAAIRKANKAKNEKEREDITYDKGSLCIAGVPYIKIIHPPTPEEIIDISEKQLDDILQMQVPKGIEIVKGDSKFTSYLLDTSDPAEVQKAYIKIKLVHTKARHIVCAYNLPGKETHLLQDYCDDEEHGAGSKLLQILLDQKQFSRAVFVVRICGRDKLGYNRFVSYAEALEGAVKKIPYNTHLKIQQEWTERPQKETRKTSYQYQHISRSKVRGAGFRGSGARGQPRRQYIHRNKRSRSQRSSSASDTERKMTYREAMMASPGSPKPQRSKNGHNNATSRR